MNFLYKRPLFAFCFAFVVGSAFFFSFSKLYLFIAISVLLSCLVPLLFFFRRNVGVVFLTVGFLFASVFSLFMVHYRYSHLSKYKETEATICFTVLEINSRNDEGNAVSVQGYIESINEERESVNGNILFEKGVVLSVGDRFLAEGSLSYIVREENEYLFASGSRVSFTVLHADKVGTEPLLYTLASWRQTLDSRIRSAGDGDSAALLAAILFGYRDNLSEKVNINFRQTGFTHAIAVSGLNLTILIGVVFVLLGAVRVPYAPRSIVSIIFAILYSALSGFSPSVVRAAFMASVLLIARLFRRPHDPPTTLFFSAAVLLLFDPALALSASYLLSVMATFGLVVVGAMLEKDEDSDKGIIRRLISIFFSKEGLLLSLGAIAATVLITAVLFREFSVLSPLSTALLSPLVTLILWLAIPLLIFPGSIIGKAADDISEAIIYCIDLLAEIPHTRLSLAYPFIIPVIFVLSFATVVLIFGKKRSRLVVITPLLIMAVFIFSAARINSLTFLEKEPVSYLAIDKAEATVYLSEGVSIVFDTSGNQAELTKSAIKKVYDGYMTELSVYAVTDYTSLLPENLSLVGGSIKTRQCLLPIPRSDKEAEIAEKAKSVADYYGIKCRFYENGEEFSVGSTSIVIYRAYSEKGEVMYSLRTQSGVLTYISSGFHLYGDIKAANTAVLKSSCVIIGAYNTKTPTHIPYSVDGDILRRVIWSDKSVTRWHGEKNAEILKKTTVIFDPAQDEFSLKELS